MKSQEVFQNALNLPTFTGKETVGDGTVSAKVRRLEFQMSDDRVHSRNHQADNIQTVEVPDVRRQS